jgi:HSP20 family protein
MNVWASPDGLVVDAELPGANPADVDISVMADELTISGKINNTPQREGETIHRQERPAGDFSRTLQLPFRAKPEGVRAAFKDGILRVSIPRSEEEKPKKIKIEAA